MDSRLELIRQWLKSNVGLKSFDITPASADASFRRYFRVSFGADSRIVMDAPPDKEDCRPYIMVTRAFSNLGLNVPHIYQADIERGFLLLGDLGKHSFLDMLNETNVEQLYGDALDTLFVLQSHSNYPGDYFPPYNRILLRNEMNLFRDWYLQGYLGLILKPDQHRILDETCELLVTSALEQPTVWVHRDYHSRNLMVVESNNPGILDFQDAVIGPITYDLVSLLRDCYIQWPQARVQGWVDKYYLRLVEIGIIDRIDNAHFTRWFDLMGIQRHLKAIGIFSRLMLRDGKSGYLNDIPRTLNYITSVSARYPELGRLNSLLNGLIK